MTTRILAIDTTAEYGSIALVIDGALVEETPLHAPDGFGQVLFGEILALLGRHGLRVMDIDCFASATGPGSFTGVRIGLTAAKGLAESAGKRVAGVSNLRALAFYGETHRRAVVLDARRRDVYAAVYDADLQLVSPEVVTPFVDWIAGLEDAGEFLSQDFTPYAASLPPRFASTPVREVPRALAGAIGRIAARDAMPLDPAVLDANYVRRSDAELFWVER